MKMILISFVVLLCTSLLMASDYRIIDTKTGKPASVSEMAKTLNKSKVIYFGEFHDNSVVHKLEMDFLEAMYKLNPRLIVSFEMFERDTQPYLDMYVKGDMNEEDFLLNSRPWSNYNTDYKPLLDFAKTHSLTVIAANVPRPIAGKVVRSGAKFRDQLSDKDQVYTAATLNAWNDEYKDKFMRTMHSTTMHGMPGDETLYDNMYLAQCLKDDTMAESILMFMAKAPKSMVVHFNGDFHSNSYLGTVQRVQIRQPKLKQAVISPIYVPDMDGFVFTKEYAKQANFIIILNEPATEMVGEE